MINNTKIMRKIVYLICLSFVSSIWCKNLSGARKRVPRMVLGYAAKIVNYPFAVKIDGNGMTCTGSIIHKSWVLTAAHCFDLVKDAKTIKIIAGNEDVFFRSKEQVRQGISYYRHPQYWTNFISFYDYGLVEVEPFELSDRVAIATLENTPWPTGALQYKRKCTAVGWGRLVYEGAKSNSLMFKEVTAKHGPEACLCWHARNSYERMVCLESTEVGGPCTGDSGGPLVCDNKIVGVFHYLYRSRRCLTSIQKNTSLNCREDHLSYMYLCPELEWIAKYVPTAVPKKPMCGGCVAQIFNIQCITLAYLTTILWY